MVLQAAKAPNIRYKENVHTLFTDVIIAMVPLLAMAYFYYGPRTAVLSVTAAVLCFVLDLICRKLAGKTIKLNDFSAVITGLVIVMLLPVTVPYYVVATACVFGILITKHPFGGLGANMFNPACAGVAFVTACWPEVVFHYPKPFDEIPVFITEQLTLYQSPASVLKMNGEPSGDLLQMFLGNFSGPMGATAILVIISCLLFLLFRRTITWHIPFSVLASVGVMALLFPRVQLNITSGMVFELFAGCVVFGAVFVASDPVTSPSLPAAKLLFGAGIGVVTMLLRYFGGFEEGFVFAVLILNAMTYALDRFALWLRYDLFMDGIQLRLLRGIPSVVMRGGRHGEKQKTKKNTKRLVVTVERVGRKQEKAEKAEQEPVTQSSANGEGGGIDG
ncbi:MAG: RnfABCDGE type electron transport complex subunit D [Acetanaerobacterium sp.]